jgi:hypothetical protein
LALQDVTRQKEESVGAVSNLSDQVATLQDGLVSRNFTIASQASDILGAEVEKEKLLGQIGDLQVRVQEAAEEAQRLKEFEGMLCSRLQVG